VPCTLFFVKYSRQYFNLHVLYLPYVQGVFTLTKAVCVIATCICYINNHIKTHGSVSCCPRKRGVRTQRENIDAKNKVQSYAHSELRGLWPNKTKFAVKVLAYRERTHTKSEINCASCSWNINLQKVAHILLFAHLQKNCHKMQMRNRIAFKFGRI